MSTGAPVAPTMRPSGSTAPRSSTTSSQAPRIPQIRPPRGRRVNPLLVTLAVMMIAGAALGAGLLYSTANKRVEVMVAATELQAGTQISKDQLRIAEVAYDHNGPARFAMKDEFRLYDGKYLISRVPAGVPLSADMVTDRPAPEASKVAVSAALPLGRMPAEAIAGRTVTLVKLTETNADDAASTVVAERARIISRVEASDGGAIATFEVEGSTYTQVAQAGSSEKLAVVLLPEEDR